MDIALFDFDGTITTQDTFPAFLRRAVRPGRLRVASILLTPFKVLRALRLISACTYRAMEIRMSLGGRSANNLWYNGERFAQRYLMDHLHPQAMERIAWHKERGDRVVVVCEALNVYMRSWCDTQGVELICSVLEERNGKSTGRVVGSLCSNKEKASRIEQEIDLLQYGKVYAYGDSPHDMPMLNLASERVFRWRPMTQS